MVFVVNTEFSVYPAPRTRLVKPHSGRNEALSVVVLMSLIVALMALRFSLLVSPERVVHLKPYQLLDSELKLNQNLVYRSMLSSLADIDDVRNDEGQWPEAVLLEEEGILPFASKLLPAPADQLKWVSYDGGTWVDYLGTDISGKNRISYILRLIDLHGNYHPHPHPGVDYDPDLSIAAQVWIYTQPGRPYPGERLPEAGWLWVLGPAEPGAGRR